MSLALGRSPALCRAVCGFSACPLSPENRPRGPSSGWLTLRIGAHENQEDFLSTVACSVAQLWLRCRTCLFSKGLSISCFSYSPSSLP